MHLVSVYMRFGDAGITSEDKRFTDIEEAP
jgi:hypothetical protein